MTHSRPSKGEREAWAELLGDEKRTSRRWRGRIGLLVVALLLFGVPYAIAKQQGLVGCTSPAEMTAFWAKDAGQVSAGERDREIRRELRCVEFIGKTRNEVKDQLGEWTPVAQYPVASSKVKGLLLVWSNSANTEGIAVEFTGPRGHAIKVSKYIP